MVTDARHRLATVKQLPYDAEIEFLESTGTQYIDLGIQVEQNIGFSTKVDFKNSEEVNTIFGAQNLNSYFGFSVLDEVTLAIGSVENEDTLPIDSFPVKTVAEYNYLGNRVLLWTANGNSDSSTIQIISGSIDCNIFAFCANNISLGPIEYAIAKLYYLKLTIGQTLVRDFIPVRFTNELGQSEGAMYDKVSGGLFRNQGSGEFVMGDDVATAPYVVTYRKPFVSFTPPPPYG